MFDLALKAIVFLSTLSYGANLPLDLFDMIFLRTGTIFLFLTWLFADKSQPDLRVMKVLAGLLGIGFVSIFLHNFNAVVMRNYLNLFFVVFFFYMVITAGKDYRGVVKWMVAAGFLNIGVFLLQQVGFSPFLNTPGQIDTQGALLGSSPRLTIYLALISPLNLWLALASLAVSVMSRQYSLAAIVLAYLVWSNKGKLSFKVFLGTTSVVFLYLVRNSVMSSVMFRWQNTYSPAIHAFANRPLLGCGLGVMPIPGDVLISSALQFICGAGIVSLVWTGYVGRQFGKDVLKSPMMGCVLLLSLIEYPVEIPRLSIPLAMLLAIFVLSLRKETQHVSG